MRGVRFSLAGLFVAGAIFATLPASAQSIASDMDFQGVKGLRVTTSPLPIDSVDCNIEPGALIRDLRRQFEFEGLKAISSDDALAVVTILSARDAPSNTCSSTLMLGAYKKASFFDKDVGWIRTGYVVVWQSAVLVTSRSDGHSVQVRDALARIGDALLKEWHTANASPSAGR